MTDTPDEALKLAARFHEVYEMLAPSFGYETRQETRTFDPATPNGKLMIAVCAKLLPTLPAAAPADGLVDEEYQHLFIDGYFTKRALAALPNPAEQGGDVVGDHAGLAAQAVEAEKEI